MTTGPVNAGNTPEQNRQIWLDALRSRRYKKGRKVLRYPVVETYCCLGVLAALIDPDGWDAGPRGYRWHDLLISLDPDSLALVGLDDSQQEELIKLNDTCNTFGPVITRIKDFG